MIRAVFTGFAILLLTGCAPLISLLSSQFQGQTEWTAQAEYSISATDTPNATVTSVPPQTNILFSDDFSNPQSGWLTNDNEFLKSFYDEGEYVIRAYAGSGLRGGVASRLFTDGILSVQLRQTDGDPEQTGSFIAWRYVDTNNYYALLIRGSGEYLVYKILDGEWKALTLDAFSPFLATDGTGIEVSITFSGDVFDIYFNSQYALSITDPTFSTGSIGFGAVASSNSDVEVRMDDLTLFAVEGFLRRDFQLKPDPTPIPEYRTITRDELMVFITADTTNWNAYDVVNYNCVDYAIDLVANARKENLKVWIVGVTFNGKELGHSFVAFETSDRGVVYIEPQGDYTYSNLSTGINLCDDWGAAECWGYVESIQFYSDCNHKQVCIEYSP